MVAPIYAYRDEVKLQGCLGASDGSAATSNDILIAVFLQNSATDSGDGYFNSSDIESLKISKIKQLFKIDGFHLIADSSGKMGFIGFCDINGENIAFHNLSRISNITVPYGGNNSFFVILNDAGLNRLADSPIFMVHTGVSTRINVLNNSIFVHAFFKSAFWNDTISTHIVAADSVHLESPQDSANLGSISNNNSLELNEVETIIPDTLIFRVGKTYIISLKAVNSEGSRYSTSYLSLSPAPGAVTFRYGTQLADAIASVTAGTVYVNRKISNAIVSDDIIFFSNLSATSFVATGYYLSLIVDENGYQKYFRVTTATGNVTEIGNIVASRHQDIYYYFSTISAANAIAQAASQRILYYQVLTTPAGSDFENRRYYNGPFDTSVIAAQGYYVKADRSTVIYVGANGESSVLVG